MYYSVSDVKKLGTILGIWAHPDDEAWTSAGLMKMALNNGQKVAIVTATSGDAGESANPNKWPTEKISQIRKQEQEKCIKCLGHVTQIWLDYNDGELKNVQTKEVIPRLELIVKRIKPDTIITFEEQGLTGHDDHKAVHAWAKETAKNTNKRLLCAITSYESYNAVGRDLDREYDIFFNINSPKLVKENKADVCVKLSEKILNNKMECLKSHASQVSKLFEKKETIEKLKLMIESECYMEQRVS